MAKSIEIAEVGKIPRWARGVLVVGAVLVGGYLVYKISRSKLFRGKSEDEKNVDRVLQNVEDEIKKIKLRGGSDAVLSFPQSIYDSLSNYIVNQLSGAEWTSTEFDVAVAIMKIVKKPIDWLNLVKTFGSRKVADIGWGETTYELPTLLNEQLDGTMGTYSVDINGYKKSGTLTKVKDILRGYLASKKVTL
jgi:hypothetical protein